MMRIDIDRTENPSDSEILAALADAAALLICDAVRRAGGRYDVTRDSFCSRVRVALAAAERSAQPVKVAP